jgi:large repetitive protein
VSPVPVQTPGAAELVSPSRPAKIRAEAYQGFGASTPGGSGRIIVRVTNLNDSGPGSFREAVSKGNRTVVFDVTGEILLTRTVELRGAFITVDGFTAPSNGITLKNFGLSINGRRGAHDVIVRGIRIRDAGISTDKEESDGISIVRGAYNVVIDHVSIQGSEDGNLDIGTDARDVTVSWSILAEPRDHQKNMLIKYNPSRISLHHNLFVHARQRNPQVAIDNVGTAATDTTLDMRNNLVWDWRGGYGTLIWYGARANVVNNFYSSPRSAPKNQTQALIVGAHEDSREGLSAAARVYASGNFSADKLDQDINSSGNEKNPLPAAPVDTQDACTAAHAVLSGAGVRPLDSIDERYISAISLPSCMGNGSSTAR